MTGLPSSDPRLALAIKRASNRFYGDTNRQALLEQDYQERHYLDGGRTILLRAAPVVSTASVTFQADGGTPYALTAADYRLEPQAGILRLPSSYHGLVTIDYRAGYAEIPGDVEDAVLEHAATVAMVMAHLQQEGGGNTQASYGKEAMVGTTAKWTTAVRRYNLQDRA